MPECFRRKCQWVAIVPITSRDTVVWLWVCDNEGKDLGSASLLERECGCADYLVFLVWVVINLSWVSESRFPRPPPLNHLPQTTPGSGPSYGDHWLDDWRGRLNEEVIKVNILQQRTYNLAKAESTQATRLGYGEQTMPEQDGPCDMSRRIIPSSALPAVQLDGKWLGLLRRWCLCRLGELGAAGRCGAEKRGATSGFIGGCDGVVVKIYSGKGFTGYVSHWVWVSHRLCISHEICVSGHWGICVCVTQRQESGACAGWVRSSWDVLRRIL